MNKSVVKKSFCFTAKNNKMIMVLLILAVLGAVTASLIPPQILRLVIDQNLVPKNPNGLIRLAAFYLAVLVLVGILIS
jgi:ATP-binding cassette subfamily B protein